MADMIFQSQPRRTGSTASRATDPNRVPFISRLPHGARRHFVAMVAEFIGTFLFLFIAFAGTQVANTTGLDSMKTASSEVNRLLYISLSFGFSLAVNAWVFFRISGGLFNPAVRYVFRYPALSHSYNTLSLYLRFDADCN